MALQSLVRERMTAAMRAADRIHHRPLPLPRASELCFQPTSHPHPACACGAARVPGVLLAGAALSGSPSLDSSPGGRLEVSRSWSLWEHPFVWH